MRFEHDFFLFFSSFAFYFVCSGKNRIVRRIRKHMFYRGDQWRSHTNAYRAHITYSVCFLFFSSFETERREKKKKIVFCFSHRCPNTSATTTPLVNFHSGKLAIDSDIHKRLYYAIGWMIESSALFISISIYLGNKIQIFDERQQIQLWHYQSKIFMIKNSILFHWTSIDRVCACHIQMGWLQTSI